MNWRSYDPKKDKDAYYRIWREVGWLRKEKEKEAMMNSYIECGRALVAEINGEAECIVNSAPGTINYLNEKLTFSGVTGATTSRIARKRGLATRLMAQLVAEDAKEGIQVCGLGMFEQGFYNRIGFGTGSYVNKFKFDPSTINVTKKARIPKRITTDDWENAHNARLNRLSRHGACHFLPPVVTQVQMHWANNGFGLGYEDDNKRLTHYFWGGSENVERGPYYLSWIVFQNWEQFLELMAVLKSLGDQVRLVRMEEPPGIQLQDLLQTPFKYRQITKGSNLESNIQGYAYWQVRMCDLQGCLAKTHLKGEEEVRFNLKLTDPIEQYLNKDTEWQGLSGEYIITLSSSSEAEKGKNQSLPTLKASVGAFTRMWLGICPATGLAATDELLGSPDLLKKLDWVLRLPVPRLDWEF
ncbi:MAG: GNAT family N-acetyltransferase [Candidatus Hermodarchaeota archaeon]